MNWRDRREVIATLLRAGRPDLAQCVVARQIGYWEKQVKTLQSRAQQLKKSTLLYSDGIKKAQGRSSYLYKSLVDAAKSLDRFVALVDPLKSGVEEGVIPLRQAAEVKRAS